MDSADALPEGRTADGAAVSQLSMYDWKVRARGAGTEAETPPMYDVRRTMDDLRKLLMMTDCCHDFWYV